MKIALISPKGVFLSKDREFRRFLENVKKSSGYRTIWSGFNAGLLIVASLTPRDIFNIVFIDENVEEINFEEKYDIVAISAITQQATRAYEIASAFKKSDKKVTVVIGGIHATALPYEAKKYADSVIIGEAEETWPIFIEDFLKKRTKDFYKSEKLFDLEKSPLPAYDLLNTDNYKMVWVQTTRGCPGNCEFCVSSTIFGKKYRMKKISSVIKEINVINEAFKNKNIKLGFADDNMFVNKKFSKDLLLELKKLKIKWFAQTDVTVASDVKFLSLLKESGCELLFIGFETVSTRSFNSSEMATCKTEGFKKYPTIINRIQSLGIGVMGSFMLGLDGDTVSTFTRLANFIIKNKIYASQVTILTPLPATRLRVRLEKENRILPTDWSNYTFGDVNFIPKNMSPRELQKGFLYVHKKIYVPKVRNEVNKYFKRIYVNNLSRKN